MSLHSIKSHIYYQLIVYMFREVIPIFLITQSKKQDIIAFLKELRELLEEDDFNIDSDFTLIKKNKPDDEEHSTTYTLLDLDYDSRDIVDRLKELTVAEYSETKIDKDDLNTPLLFVFGKDINRKLVYVKLKIKEKDNQKRRVLCVSFHYARYKMNFPYA